MYYIGNFIFNTNQEQTLEEDRRHGEFSLIIAAGDPVEAIWKFRTASSSTGRKAIFFRAIARST